MFSFFKRFKKKGVDKMKLKDITDHHLIDVDKAEYQRIATSKKFYSGNLDSVTFINSNGERAVRPYYSINMLKVIASNLSSIIFNEQCNITVTNADGSDDYQNFIDSVFEDNGFYKNFERYLESFIALGGLVIRPYVDNGKIKLSWVTADHIYPLKSNTNNVTGIAIPSYSKVTEKGITKYYTLLEFHYWQGNDYVLKNELYVSEDTGFLGERVHLSERYDDLEDEYIFYNKKKPLYVFLRSPKMNNKNMNSPLGLGICDNALDTLKQINDVFDQFNREIKMGKRRVVISDHFLKPVASFNDNAPPVRKFDPDDDVFVALRFDKDDMTLKDITTDIRTEEYTQALNTAMRTLETQVDLSAGTFSFDPQTGVRTAREIISEDSQTYRTRNSYVSVVNEALKELVDVIIDMALSDDFALDVVLSEKDYDVAIDFFDGVFQDKTTQLDYLIKAVSAGLMPKVEAIQRAFDVTEDKAKEWLTQVTAEQLSVDADTLDVITNGMLGAYE